jgi:LPXTG-motif cell wall-anchored protein
MTIRSVCRALTVATLTCGVTAMGPIARAQDHDADDHVSNTTPKSSHHKDKDDYIDASSPKYMKHQHHDADDHQARSESDHVTLVGCFLRTTNKDHDADNVRYILANVTRGPATTVADQNCTNNGTGQLLKLKHVDDVGLNKLASGRWVELYGELGRPRDADDERGFEVDSFREVPLTPPRAALVIPVPAPPAPAVETPAPQEQAVTESPKPEATTGETPVVKKLPKTASELPLIALLGLFVLSGGLLLGVLDRRRVFGRR